MTPQEIKLWNWLRENFRPQGFHPRRQVPIGPYIVDFAFLRHRLVVEIDGGQHGYDRREARDRVRDARLAEAGYRVLRFWNHEIDRSRQVVLDTIGEALRN